jgi:hypothetical protein
MFKVNNSINASGTSFHGTTIKANIQDLIDVLGEPAFFEPDREEKVQIEWLIEHESGNVLTIYDWKERHTIDTVDTLELHIGAKRVCKHLGEDLKEWLQEKLDTLVPNL